MTVEISHTADVQAFFNEVAGLGHAEGSPRFKQIILRVLQDTARLVEDLQAAKAPQAEARSHRPRALQDA